MPKTNRRRISQVIGFLLGARFFVASLLLFALYVSTFFLFNQEESLRNFVFDFKVHAIIFCSFLSILAGGIINRFYDREKDQIAKPFRFRMQNFLREKYFLYAYIALNVFIIAISLGISVRVFLFFIVYQFVMWFYSHKLSRILIINNLTFVGLTLYPFFGMLIYYNAFSVRIFFLALYLFLILLIIDILKDTLTKNIDKSFGYTTIPNTFGLKTAIFVNVFLLVILYFVCMFLVSSVTLNQAMNFYFMMTIFNCIILIFSIFLKFKNSRFYILNFLRLWIFIGILAMLWDGIFIRI